MEIHPCDKTEKHDVPPEVVAVQSGDDIKILEKWICSATKTGAKPPKSVRGKLWSMIDSRSEPTIAKCKQAFPDHTIVPSAGSKSGLQYMTASGDKVPNLAECHVVHRDPVHGDFKSCFQHAPVHVPIISVNGLVSVVCTVGFGQNG